MDASDHPPSKLSADRSIETLLSVMAALRHQEYGCPWDKEQTYSTISPYTIEEAYEVADAIDRNDMVDLCEELGDLLLQVVFQTQIAQERGDFDFGDVVHAISKKMIRRHPYVFGDAEARARGLKKGDWERIKAEERAEKAQLRGSPESPSDEKSSILDGVSGAEPAMTVATKLQAKAAQHKFDWPSPRPVLDKMREEIDELEVEINKAGSKEALVGEVGDVLFTVVNIARHLGVDPDHALRTTNQKFRSRFAHIETALAEQKRDLSDSNLEEMDALWQAAKPGSV